MKKQSSVFFTALTAAQLTDLTMEVKETIATGLTEPVRKMFTTTDLWNVHRQARSRAQRKYL